MIVILHKVLISRHNITDLLLIQTLLFNLLIFNLFSVFSSLFSITCYDWLLIMKICLAFFTQKTVKDIGMVLVLYLGLLIAVFVALYFYFLLDALVHSVDDGKRGDVGGRCGDVLIEYLWFVDKAKGFWFGEPGVKNMGIITDVEGLSWIFNILLDISHDITR